MKKRRLGAKGERAQQSTQPMKSPATRRGRSSRSAPDPSTPSGRMAGVVVSGEVEDSGAGRVDTGGPAASGASGSSPFLAESERGPSKPDADLLRRRIQPTAGRLALKPHHQPQ